MKALILSLATARLTQLIVDDEITQPIRDRVDSWGENAPQNSLPERVDTAINCHACTSTWAGAGILVAEQTGVGRFLVRVLALSQAALAIKAVIERIDR
jgi:hypothetical protein